MIFPRMPFTAIALVFGMYASTTTAGILDVFGVDDDFQNIIERTLPEIEDLSGRIIAKGENSGDLLLVQAGNEAAMAISYAKQAFGETMDDLDASTRQMLLNVDRSLRTVERSSEILVELSDMMAIDLSLALGNLPLSGDSPFAIRRLDGAIVPPLVSLSGHPIVLVGPNFTQTSELSVSLTINDIPIAVDIVAGDNQHSMELILSQNEIDKFKIEREINITRAAIQISREPSGLFSGLKSPTERSLEIRLSFLPDIAGTIQPVYQTRNTDWVPNSEPKSERFRTLPGLSHTIDDRPAALSSGPTLGAKRVIPSSITATCSTDIRPAYRFPRKVVAADDQIFSRGWTGTGGVCGRHPLSGLNGSGGMNTWGQPYVIAANQFNDEFGIRQRRVIGILRRWDANGDNSCTLLPDELKSLAEPISYDFSPCRTVRVRAPLINAEKNIVTWDFYGSGGDEALYTLSANFETFSFTEPRELNETSGEVQDIVFGVNEIDLFVDQYSTAFVEVSPVWSPVVNRVTLRDLGALEREAQISQVSISRVGDIDRLLFTYSQ